MHQITTFIHQTVPTESNRGC